MSASVPEPVRRYVYGVMLALAAAGIVYGIIDNTQAAIWLGVASAVLSIPTAELPRAKVRPTSARSQVSQNYTRDS